MAKRKVEWSSEAKLSFREILDYYTERNGNKKYSSSLSRKIKKIISFINSHNLIGKSADEPNVRVVVFKNYEIFYEINDESIQILLVWDSRRDPGDLKLK